MKKNLFVIGLMLMCVCAFALPRLLSHEPAGFKELKEATAQAPDLENAKLHQLSDVKIAGLGANKAMRGLPKISDDGNHDFWEYTEIIYVNYFRDVEDGNILHQRGATVTHIQDSIGNTYVDMFGTYELAPKITFDEEGTAKIELGQVLHETDTLKYILVEWDGDIIDSGLVDLIDFHEFIGVYVINKVTNEGSGYYCLYYALEFFRPNVSMCVVEGMYDYYMRAYAWQSEGELWISHFAAAQLTGYCFKFDIDGDKLCATDQIIYPSYNVYDDETGETDVTGDFYLVGLVGNNYFNQLYATISYDRYSFSIDTEWTGLTEKKYWFRRLSPTTVHLQFAINDYVNGGSDDPGIVDVPGRPQVVNNLLVNGDFEDPGYVQSDQNVWNWLDDRNSINADSIPGWKRVEGIWNGTISVCNWEEERFDDTYGFGYNGNNHYVHYQFCPYQGWTGFGLQQYVEGLTPGREYTLDMFVGHYFPNEDANITFGIEIYDKPHAEGNEYGTDILIIRDSDEPIGLAYGDLDYYAVKFTAPSDGVIIRLLGYNWGGQNNENGNAWVEWDEVRLYDADAPVDYYLIGEKTDWEAKDEYRFTLNEGSDHVYALDSVTLAPEDTYYIANADKSIVYYLAGDEAVAPHTLYPLMKGNGWQINAADSIKNATLLADFKNLDFMVRTDGKHTIDKPYTVKYDNSLSNWENVYAYWWNGQTGQECCGFPGQQMTLQGDTIYVIDFEQDWVPTGILFSDGIGNQTADFNFVNGQTYDFNGKKVEWVVVNVPSPGELWATLESIDGDFGDICFLKIVGELNDADMGIIFGLMHNLEILDLGEAVVENIPPYWCEGQRLRKIILPPSVTTIGGGAFEYCSYLEEVAFNGENNVKIIEQVAFYDCSSLTTFDISGVETLGDFAFSYCISFKDFKVPSLNTYGGNIFSHTGIEEIPKGFFGSEDKDISNLGNLMFYGCNQLRKVDLPSTLVTLTADVFYGCPIDTVICRAVTPPNLDYNAFSSYNTLLVPMPSLNQYQSAYPWYYFSNIQPLLDEPVQSMVITNAFDLYVDETMQPLLEGCDATLTYGYINYNTRVGELSISGVEPLRLGSLTYIGGINSRRNGSSDNFLLPSMIVEEGTNLEADSVSVILKLAKCGSSTIVWHFICLPFDVNYDDIVASEGTYWVIRKYDTEARAAGNTSSTWVNLESGDVLKAGKGYIVSAYNGEYDENGYSLNAVMTFPAASQGNAIFKASNAPIALDEIASDMPQNRSWNFVGNPYPAYFNLRDMLTQNGEPFETPISLWRGSSYEAYCALDDDLYLRPFEAFFLQRPLDYSELIFANYGRMHYSHAINGGTPGMYMPERITARGEREVFTFTVGIDSLSNRARIVINEKAAMGYEVGRDAMKIFETSDNCPLLYVSSDASYAICERPLAEGTAVLGFTAAKDGAYTLSLSGKHAEGWKVEVTDKLAGITIDLAEADYEFYAEAGTNGDRFLVKFTEPALTGIDAISTGIDNNAATTVTNLAGITVYSGAYCNMPELPAGVYVITIDGTPYKVSVK